MKPRLMISSSAVSQSYSLVKAIDSDNHQCLDLPSFAYTQIPEKTGKYIVQLEYPLGQTFRSLDLSGELSLEEARAKAFDLACQQGKVISNLTGLELIALPDFKIPVRGTKELPHFVTGMSTYSQSQPLCTGNSVGEAIRGAAATKTNPRGPGPDRLEIVT